MPSEMKLTGKGGAGDGGGGDNKDSKKNKAKLEASSSGDSLPKKDHHKPTPTGKKRKDGTANKMSFDVDELEEGAYVQVEDDEDVEELVEFEDIPEGERSGGTPQDGDKNKDGGRGDGTSPEELRPLIDETPGYKIRPDLTQKFRPGTVQVIIENAIKERLQGKEYSVEESDEWVRSILEDVHEKVKGQNYRRYKIISQITLGEKRGEAASSATRCLWDAEADCMATYTFLNDSIFCNGTVYGIYFY